MTRKPKKENPNIVAVGTILAIGIIMLYGMLVKDLPILANSITFITCLIALIVAIYSGHKATRAITVFSILTIICGLALFGSITSSMSVQGNPTTSVTPEIAAQRYAKSIKDTTTLPYQVDSTTVLEDITSSGNSLQYHERVSGVDTSSVTSESLTGNLRTSVCANETLVKVLWSGVSLEYLIVGETGQEYDITLTSSDCPNAPN